VLDGDGRTILELPLARGQSGVPALRHAPLPPTNTAGHPVNPMATRDIHLTGVDALGQGLCGTTSCQPKSTGTTCGDASGMTNSVATGASEPAGGAERGLRRATDHITTTAKAVRVSTILMAKTR
jgi:hypothetical protein